MTKIRNNIYLGHEFDAHMDPINQKKLTVVYNVAENLNDPQYGWKCCTVKVGLSDDKHNRQDMIDLAVMTLDHLVAAGHTVLIHCRAGMSRSPYILALHLAKAENRTFDDVWAELRRLRPEVLEKSKLA